MLVFIQGYLPASGKILGLGLADELADDLGGRPLEGAD
jgi:hypothetical protein